jgi:hypothetical protein
MTSKFLEKEKEFSMQQLQALSVFLPRVSKAGTSADKRKGMQPAPVSEII